MANRSGGDIKFRVDFLTDQSSLNKLKTSLQDLQKIKLGDFKGSAKDLDEMQETAKKVLIALEKAFNPTLNTTNISTFQSELQKTVGNIDQVYNKLKLAGPQGEVAFHQMATEVLTTNLKLKETNSLIDSMGKTMVNTVKWGIASSIMNTFTQSVQGAFQYVQSLEKSLTNIRIVTGDSTEKMAQFALQANRSAQALGKSTLDYSKASLTFYQQGLNDEDVQARTEATLKAQNITGAGSLMADYLTSVWNGYKVANEQAELYVDKLAAVADSSASDMNLLAIAMSKVASTANNMGVDIDQLNAQIATVVATTRQAPESVGTAFKTIYTRMNDIKTGSDEAEISLGNYSGKMALLGVNVLDATGHLRDTGLVMDLIGERWSTMTKEQQVYLAQTMGGQRQVNQLMALFDNWTTYSLLLNTSLEAEGTLTEKNSRYMESLGAKMEQLGAAGERVKAALINEDLLKGGVLALTNLVNLMGNFIESIGGGSTALLAFGSLAVQVFQDTIARLINNVITNIQNKKNNEEIKAQDIKNTEDFGKGQGYQEGVINHLVDNKAAIQDYYKIMSLGLINAYNEIIKTVAAELQVNVAIKENVKSAESLKEALSKNEDFGKRLSENLLLTASSLSNVVELVGSQISLKWSPNKILGDTLGFANTFAENYEQLVNAFGGNEQVFLGLKTFEELQAKLNEPETPQALVLLRDKWVAFINLLKTNTDNVAILDTLNQELESSSARLNAAERDAENFRKQMLQLASVRTFTQTLAGIGQLAAGIKSLTNLTKVWGNENLSTGEKVLQTITNVSMSIPMIINGFSKMSDTLSLIKTGIQGFINQYGSLQKAVESFATARKIAAAEEAGAVNLQLLSQEELQAAYEVTGIKAWASLGPYVAIAAAVAAAVGLIVLAYKDWNKEADAAKKASEIAADAKKTYDDLKTSLDDVKSALDDLHAAEDNLDGLTKGTQEWRDALQLCNDKVLELISNYPELALYVTNQNGQLKLSAEGEQAYLDQLQAGVQNARNASYIASSDSREADARAAAANIGHNSIYAYDDQGGATYASADQVLAVTEAIDKVVGLGDSLKDGLSGLADEISTQTSISEEVVGVILSNEDAVLQLKAQLEQNANADKLMYEAMAANVLQGNSTYESMDDYGKQVANAIAGSDLDAEVLKLKKELINTMTDGVNKWSGAGNQQVKYILDLLNKAQGTNWKLDSNAVRGTDTNRTFAFLDLAGLLHTYTKLQIASTIAAKQALENLGTSAEKAALILNGIDANVSDKAQEAVKQWVSGQQMTATTQAGLDELKGQNIQDILGEEGIQALAEQWNLLKEDGTADIDALNERWKASCKDMSNAFYTVAQDASISIQQAFNSIKDNEGLKNATLDFQRMVVGDMQKALAKDPTGGLLKNVTDFYGKIQDFEAFDDVIEDFDFSKGPEALKKLLELIGAIDKSVDLSNVLAFINLMKLASLLSPELNYKNVHDITDKLKRGDTVDADQALILKGAGVNVDAFFLHMADGSLRLKTNAETFQKYIDNITMEPFKAKIDDLQNKIDGINTFNDSKWAAGNEQGNTFEDLSSVAAKSTSGIVTNVDQEKFDAQLQYLDLLNLEEEEQEKINDIKLRLNDDGTSNRIQDYQEISKLLQDHAEEYNHLNDLQQLNIDQVAILRELMANINDPGLDLDVDEDKWEKLSEHLQKYADLMPEVSEELKNNAEAADDVAEAILRYDSAIGQVKDNYDDWLKALQSGSIEDQVLATEDLENVYSDLLDLPFDNVLSADFLQNVDNLNLLKLAANGSELAYNQLAEAASQDIMANVGINDESLAQFNTDLATIENQIDAGIDDLLVGAFVDDTQALQAMNELINAADMTASQATDLLASMGVDALVESIQVPESQKQGMVDAVPNVTSQSVPVPNIVQDDTGQVTVDETMVEVPTINYEAVTDVALQEGQKMTTVLRVKSARKASGGGFKYKNSSAGNKGGGGGGHGGGGKGGKGGKSKPAKTVDKPEKKKDRYYNVNAKAKRQASALEKLKKEQAQLTGKDTLKNLEDQLEILKKQEDIIRERLSLLRQERDLIKNDLKKYGGEFDKKSGRLLNYDTVFKNILDEFEKVRKWYNGLSGDLQEEEGNKKKLENAKKAFELGIKKLEEYETISEKIRKTIQETYDNAKLIIDKQVLMFNIKIDAAIDFTQARNDLQDFIRDVEKLVRDDDIIEQNRYSFKKMGNYFNSNGSGSIQTLQQKLQDAINNKNGVYTTVITNPETGKKLKITDTARQQEDIKKITKLLEDEMRDYQKLQEEVKQSLFDMIDQVDEAFQEQIELYEYISDLIDHNVKVTQLLFGDDAYEKLDKYYNRIEENNNKQLDFLRRRQLRWYGHMMEELDRMKQAAYGSNNYKLAEEAFKKYEKLWMEGQKDLNAQVEKSIQDLQDKYANSISKIFEQMELKITGGFHMDTVEDLWDKINDLADMYLDKINGMYLIDKLENAFKDAIDNAEGSLSAQQSLNDLMNEQLGYLKDKDKLTQYDVDRANALLQIEIKRLALEQSRNSKTKLRLRRDSQGNYSYQYVANQEENNKAQQLLADAQNSLINSTKLAYKNNVSDIIKTQLEANEALASLWQGANESDEDFQKRKLDIEQYYDNKINGLLEQNTQYRNDLMKDSFDLLAKMYNINALQFNAMTEAQKNSLMTNLFPQWSSLGQQVADNLKANGGWFASVAEHILQAADAQKDYYKGLNDILKNSGQNFAAIASDADLVIKQAERLLESNEDLVESNKRQIQSVQSTINKVKELVDTYKDANKEAQKWVVKGYQEGYLFPDEEILGISGKEDSAARKALYYKVYDPVVKKADSASDLENYTEYKPSNPTISNLNQLLGNSSTPVSSTSPSTSFAPATSGALSSFNYGGSISDFQTALNQLQTNISTNAATYQGKLGALENKFDVNLKAAQSYNSNIDSVLKTVNNKITEINSNILKLTVDNRSGLNAIREVLLKNTNTIEQKVDIKATFPNLVLVREIQNAFRDLTNMAAQAATKKKTGSSTKSKIVGSIKKKS